MKRSDLLKSKEFWIFQIQNNLYNMIETYRKDNKMTKTKLAEELGFHKSYISQVLNGDFDHKVSKLVELSLASGKAPIVSFVDLDQYIRDDSDNKTYTISTNVRPIRVINFNDNIPSAERDNLMEYHPDNISYRDSYEKTFA